MKKFGTDKTIKRNIEEMLKGTDIGFVDFDIQRNDYIRKIDLDLLGYKDTGGSYASMHVHENDVHRLFLKPMSDTEYLVFMKETKKK